MFTIWYSSTAQLTTLRQYLPIGLGTPLAGYQAMGTVSMEQPLAISYEDKS